MYGAGDAKVGSIVGGTKAHGKELKAKFLKNTPALKLLRDSIERTLVKSSTWIGGTNKVQWRRRFVKSLDGRKIFIRSPHSALNAILQSAGAAICKYWILETERILVNERGYKHGWDGDFAYMMWVHKDIHCAH